MTAKQISNAITIAQREDCPMRPFSEESPLDGIALSDFPDRKPL